MKRDFWTIPNALSVLRVLFVLVFLYVIFSGGENARWWGLFWLLLGALTDKLDGDLARWLHAESEWGRILDPLADKIGIALVGVALVVKGWLPLWFVAVLLARDLLILIGGLLIKRKTGEIVPSNMAGKWAVGVIAGTMIIAVIDETIPFLSVCIGLSLVMVALSTAGYVKRFNEIMHANRLTGNGNSG